MIHSELVENSNEKSSGILAVWADVLGIEQYAMCFLVYDVK